VLAFLSVMALANQDHHLHYALIIVCIVACCSLVCITAQEESSVDLQLKKNDPASSWSSRALSRYMVDVSKHPHFSLLLITKALNCAAIVVKGFLLYFMQDTFQLARGGAQELTARVSITAECTAALAALAAMMVLSTGGHAGGGGRDGSGEAPSQPEGGAAVFSQSSFPNSASTKKEHHGAWAWSCLDGCSLAWCGVRGVEGSAELPERWPSSGGCLFRSYRGWCCNLGHWSGFVPRR